MFCSFKNPVGLNLQLKKIYMRKPKLDKSHGLQLYLYRISCFSCKNVSVTKHTMRKYTQCIHSISYTTNTDIR